MYQGLKHIIQSHSQAHNSKINVLVISNNTFHSMIQILNKHIFAQQVRIFQQSLPEYDNTQFINQLFKQLDSKLADIRLNAIQNIRELIGQDVRIFLTQQQLQILYKYFNRNESNEQKVYVIEILYYAVQNGQDIQMILTEFLKSFIQNIIQDDSSFPFKIIHMHFSKLKLTLEHILYQQDENVAYIIGFIESFFTFLLNDYIKIVIAQKQRMKKASLDEIKYMKQALRQQLLLHESNIYDIINLWQNIIDFLLQNSQYHPYIMELLGILVGDYFFKVMQQFNLKQKKNQILMMINNIIIKIQEYKVEFIIQSVNSEEFILRLWNIENIQTKEGLYSFQNIIYNYYDYVASSDQTNKQYYIKKLLDQLANMSNTDMANEISAITQQYLNQYS